jgi:Polyketide cyclase / dehydrase and lipid transport
MIQAVRLVSAPSGRIFEFLSDLRNHWRLEDRFVELGGLEGSGPHGPTGGTVRILGPLGVYRTARTRVLDVEAPDAGRPGRLSGRAELGRGTVGSVSWTIETAGDQSRVVLSAFAEQATAVDRLLLALGGSWWLGRIFDQALARLAEIMARP